MIGYKLFRRRANGTLGPLFINRRLVVPVGEWLTAEEHPTNGYAYRPGWHACLTPSATHLVGRLDRPVLDLDLVVGTLAHLILPRIGGLYYM